MKIYRLIRTQLLPVTLQEAWNFFSSPANLSAITPPAVHFRIVYDSGSEKMYPGQIIRYKIAILPGVHVDWVAEITHMEEPYYFVDEQRSGPYSLWHHQHHFREVPGGVEMTDEVNYAVPLALLGRLVHAMFVEKKLGTIFDYRRAVLEQRFGKS